MNPYLTGAVAIAVLIPAAAFIWWLLGVLIYKPEGDHHRPSWWRRMRERRLEERAQDAVTVRLFQDIHNGLRGEAARAATSEMPRVEWPLPPLPPGAEQYADHFHRWAAEPEPEEPVMVSFPETIGEQDVVEFRERKHVREPYGHDAPGMPDDAYFCARDGEEWPCAAVAEDPLDVAAPEQVADAYVGGYVRHGAGEMVPKSVGSVLGTPEPEPAPLTDYGPTTGSWEAIRDEVLDGA